MGNRRVKKINRNTVFHQAVRLYVLDIVALILSFAIPWFFRIGISGQQISLKYTLICIMSIIVFSTLAFNEECYNEEKLRKTFTSFLSVVKAAFLTFSVLVLGVFFLKESDSYSRIWASSWGALFFFFLFLLRIDASKRISAHIAFDIGLGRILLIGKEKIISEFEQFISNRKFDYSIIGYVTEKGKKCEYDGALPCLGGIDSITAIIKKFDVDYVFIADEADEKENIGRLLAEVNTCSVNVYLLPSRFDIEILSRRYKDFGAFSATELAQKPIDRWPAIVKRVEDLCLSTIALLFLWPVMLITAIAIKLESNGPILFQQPRYGFNNELINVYKYRSMYTAMSDLHASQQTMKDDPRVTKVGKFIRKTSIDELPQLFNVFVGNMSLVGPRPHAAQTKAAGRLFEEVVGDYAVRHRVKPGITGLAQVSGWRGETDTEEKIIERVKCDLEYIRSWSLALDLYILVKTAWIVLFKKETAY